MNDLSPPLKAAVEEWVKTNPEATVDDFLLEIGNAIANSETRAAIRGALITARIRLADLEGGEFTVEEVDAKLRDIIENARRNQTRTPE